MYIFFVNIYNYFVKKQNKVNIQKDNYLQKDNDLQNIRFDIMESVIEMKELNTDQLKSLSLLPKDMVLDIFKLLNMNQNNLIEILVNDTNAKHLDKKN